MEKLEHVQCPMKSKYVAILANNNMVHLYTRGNRWPNWEESVKAHYSIPLSTILGSEFSTKM